MLRRLFVSENGTGKVPSSFDACCGNRVKKDVKGQRPIDIKNDLGDTADGSESASSPRTEPSAREQLPWGPRNDAKVKRLQSYEEANETIIKEETDPVSSEDSSDKEELRHLGKQLQNQSKKTRAFFKKEAEDGDEYSTLAATMKDGLNSLKEQFSDKQAIDKQTSTSKFGTASMSRATGSMGTTASQHTRATASASTKLLSRNTTTMTTMTHSVTDDEEDDPDEDEDDPKVLDKRYRKEILKLDRHNNELVDEAQHSLKRGIGYLRHKMECQGIEEPPSESEEEADGEKPRVLELGMQFRAENDQAMQTRIYTFRKRPLGIKWEKRLPITISDVAEEGYAGLEIGVKEGWKVVSINGVDCRTFKHYPQAHKALMDAVKKLPTEVPLPKQKAPPRSLLDHVCSVTIGSAAGFAKKEYDKEHYCVCEISGKPHSKVKTHWLSVTDLGDILGFGIEWDEAFDLFDFALGDNIEFSVLEKHPVEGEILLGRAELSYHSFSSMLEHEARRNKQGQGFELTLVDQRTLKLSKISLKVNIRMDMLPEKDHNINTYRSLLRKKLQALGVPREEIDASLKDARDDGASVASIVKAGVLAYHQHSEIIGRIYPFPGKSYDDNSGLEEEDLSKIREYMKRLDTSDPTRLWTDSSLKETAVKQHLKDIGRYEVKIQFKKSPAEDAEVQEVTFECRPIGIVFSEKAPIKIAKVKPGGEAERKDVKPGWIIKSINSKPCEGLSFTEASKLLNSELERLDPV